MSAQSFPDLRLPALRRFAVAITLLNLLGHTVLGFEAAWAHPLMGVLTAYTLELVLEWLDARTVGRRPRFQGGLGPLIDFLLPAHITGLAVAMLLYANDHLAPIAFAAAVAIGSKFLFRAPVKTTQGQGSRHFLNPSNFGITATLLLFPWISIAPPYQFTANLVGWMDWLLPCVIILSGSLLNSRFTGKIPLILGWVGGFIGQALLRSWLGEAVFLAALLPMTGTAFILFTFYMISDPGTTPVARSAQIFFGVAVALLYGALLLWHVAYTPFFALTLVCLGRGAVLYATARGLTFSAAQPLIAVRRLMQEA